MLNLFSFFFFFFFFLIFSYGSIYLLNNCCSIEEIYLFLFSIIWFWSYLLHDQFCYFAYLNLFGY